MGVAGLLLSEEGKAGISARQIVTRTREHVVRDIAILGTRFNLDACPWAGGFPELLSLFVDARTTEKGVGSMTWVIAILLGLILVAMISSNQAAAAGVGKVVHFALLGVAMFIAWTVLIGHSEWYYEAYPKGEWGRIVESLRRPGYPERIDAYSYHVKQNPTMLDRELAGAS